MRCFDTQDNDAGNGKSRHESQGETGVLQYLIHPSGQDQGRRYYALQYKHKGKPTTYTIDVYSDAYATKVASTTVELQGNGCAEVNFSAVSCSDPAASSWESSVTYGSGRNKGK